MLSYLESILVIVCINLIAVLGLTYFTGFTGIFSYGHAGFMAIGAYTSAICSVTYGLPFFISLLAGMLVAGFFALLVGIPTAEIKGTYFAIVALGFGEVIRVLIIVLKDITKGSLGFPGIPLKTNLFIAGTLSIIALWIVLNLVNSPLGRACKALKSDEIASIACGVPVKYVRVFSFVVSGVLCGLAGGLLAHYQTYLNPSMFNIALSAQLAIVVLVGGLGSVFGPVVATILLFGLPEMFRFLSGWRLTIYGFVIILTILLRPQGLFSDYDFKFKKKGVQKS